VVRRDQIGNEIFRKDQAEAEKISDYDAKKDFLSTASKRRDMNKKNLQKEITKVYNKLEKIKYRDDEVKKILRSLKIEKAKFMATRIRGYQELTSPGWEKSSISPELWEFHGISDKALQDVLKELDKIGIDHSYNKPSRTPDGSTHATISIVPQKFEIN
jgi:hypothetical protein